MSQRICSIEGCENSRGPSRGWCATHYDRWKRTGVIGGPIRYLRAAGKCSVDGCDRARRARGWCKTHYSRWCRNGSPEDGAQSWVIGERGDCIICGDPVPEGIGFRRYCGQSCASTFNRYGERPKSRECAICGEEFSLLARSPRTGRLRYSTASTCGRHSKPSNLRKVIPVLLDRDGPGCGICSQRVDVTLEYPDQMSPSVDHVTPRSHGGPDHVDNYRLTHLACNVRRKNRVA